MTNQKISNHEQLIEINVAKNDVYLNICISLNENMYGEQLFRTRIAKSPTNHLETQKTAFASFTTELFQLKNNSTIFMIKNIVLKSGTYFETRNRRWKLRNKVVKLKKLEKYS